MNKPATPLPWAVFDAQGKLIARMQSESEAYFYIRNRGHANGGSYVNDGDSAATEYKTLYLNERDNHHVTETERDRLRAENARLREALREMLDDPKHADYAKARAALNQTG